MNVSLIPESFSSREVKDFITFINSSEYKDSEDKMKTLINSPHYKTYTILNKQKICGKLSERGCFINWTQNKFDPPSTINKLLEFLKGREATRKKMEQETGYLTSGEEEKKTESNSNNDYINKNIKDLKDIVRSLQEQIYYIIDINKNLAKETKQVVEDYHKDDDNEETDV